MTSDTPGEATPAGAAGAWLIVLRRYVGFVAPVHLLWEIAQLPLYTLWVEGTVGEIAFAVVHCTAGDIMIASLTLLAALLLLADRAWPVRRYWAVAGFALAFGLGYTIFSEWLNTEIRGSWAYAEAMPVLPLIGAGLTPFLQWIVIPLAGFWWARRSLTSHHTRTP